MVFTRRRVRRRGYLSAERRRRGRRGFISLFVYFTTNIQHFKIYTMTINNRGGIVAENN